MDRSEDEKTDHGVVVSSSSRREAARCEQARRDNENANTFEQTVLMGGLLFLLFGDLLNWGL